MEKTLTAESRRGVSFMIPVFLVIVSVFGVLIAFGPETMGNVMHDTFHDFRHSIGFPCH